MRSFIIFCCLVFPPLLFSQPNIQIIGLFRNKALVIVDGKQKVLQVGSTFRDVTLVSASSRFAILRFNGETQKFELGSARRFSNDSSQKATLTVTSGYGGTYQTTGLINGKPVDFIIDTGASTVSLNAKLADQLGIKYKGGKEVSVITASTKVPGYMITLDRVSIGSIRLKNVEATVIESDQPHFALLGNSFLKYLTIVHKDGRMKLIQK